MLKRIFSLSFCFLHLLTQSALAVDFSPTILVIPPPAGINAHTHFTYDSFGNLDVVTDANNHSTDYDYNELGWLTQVTNPLGFAIKHTYDANGNITKTERQADTPATVWQTTEFTYDILNKLKTVKDPLNRVTTYNDDLNSFGYVFKDFHWSCVG